MDSKMLIDSANIISVEMNKFNKGNACNFGFITEDSANYRLFIGGFTDNIANGIAVGLVNLCAQAGQGADYIQHIADTAISMLNSAKGVPLQ